MNAIQNNNPEQSLTEFLDQWAAAELHGDTSAFARMLADDFIAIGPRGFMLNRDAWLGRYASGLKYEALNLDEAQVRSYGDTAVVTARQIQQGKYGEHDSSGQFRITLILVKQPGGWMLAGEQLSPIAGQP
ncbi:MAG: nuclear transport factor 2 family protein [Candidatus Chloroheliales bacterium]|nr:MAG: nuclear transport factor 2 family protein [Chloroflexota bacterium]